MTHFTLPDKKTLLACVIIVSVVSLYWIVVYHPAIMRIQRLRDEIDTIQQYIHRIENNIGKGRQLENVLRQLTQKINGLKEKVPAQEGIVIQRISELAYTLDLEVKSIRPYNRVVMEHVSKTLQDIEGGAGERIDVEIKLASEFRTLGAFLHTLREDFPHLVVVKKVDIQQGNTDKSPLAVTLQLSFFVLTDTATGKKLQ